MNHGSNNGDETLQSASLRAPLYPFATFASFCSFLLYSFRLCASVSLCELFGFGSARLCFICVSSVAFLLTSTGCSLFRTPGNGPLQNPMFIPAVDRDLLWNQTVDSVDDYFRIEREDRVRVI